MTETVHVVVPDTIDDRDRPSGGNVYDRRICTELEALGWTVHVHQVDGSWPCPLAADVAALDALLGSLPAGQRVLVDGLIASAAPDSVTRHAARRRLVVLVHMPLGAASPARREPEGRMLRAVAAVVTTSSWTRTWLVEHEHLSVEAVHVAVPGTDLAGVAHGSAAGDHLLCVGAVTSMKGHDRLLDALATVDVPWRLTCVGSLEVDPGFAATIRARAADLGGRVVLRGALHGVDLAAAYDGADVLVLASRAETYGMVVTEALAHGLPVIATAVGGVAEALGTAPDGTVPGALVRTEGTGALAAALEAWLELAAFRARARAAARERRLTLPSWDDAAAHVAEALRG